MDDGWELHLECLAGAPSDTKTNGGEGHPWPNFGSSGFGLGILWIFFGVGLVFFPTCQVRVVRFYVSCPSSSPSSSSFLLLPPLLPLRRHLRHHHRQLWAAPDLNMELQIAVGSAGPQQRAPDCSGQRRTSTASSRLQWAAPDLNSELQIAVGSAGPQPRAPDCSGQRRTSPGELPSGLGNAGPHPGSSRADWAAPDLSCQKICQKICQKYVSQECPKICQKKCQ